MLISNYLILIFSSLFFPFVPKRKQGLQQREQESYIKILSWREYQEHEIEGSVDNSYQLKINFRRDSATSKEEEEENMDGGLEWGTRAPVTLE